MLVIVKPDQVSLSWRISSNFQQNPCYGLIVLLLVSFGCGRLPPSPDLQIIKT